MNVMPGRKQMYQPLSHTRWLNTGHVRAWRSANHLLLVESRFFSEYYTRLFWADIQTVLLYRLHTHSSVLLSLEVVCVAAVLAPLVFWIRGWPLAVAFLFLFFYPIWRFGRPQWACQVTTRTNVKQFAIPGLAPYCRRLFEEVKNSVTQVQGPLPETPADAPASAAPQAASQTPPASKQPILVVHVIAFVLGLLTPFSGAFFIPYCAALVAAWFLQQDFRFPFAVRSAAVMSQILAFLRIAVWVLLLFDRQHLFTPMVFTHWRFGLPTVLFSLYGIAAVYWRSVEFARPQQKTGATVLGLS